MGFLVVFTTTVVTFPTKIKTSQKALPYKDFKDFVICYWETKTLKEGVY